MPLSVLVLSRDLKIMQVNRDFHERFGLDESDVKGRALMDIVPDGKLEEKIREVLDRSLSLEAYEIEHDFGKGGRRTLSVRAVPAHLGGSTHVLLIIVDVTEKKALEEQMQHAEKLSSLGTLTAGVAHELNTPLANILLNTQMLIEESREGGKPDVATLGIIESQAKQGSSIVRGLLEFSRQSELTSEVADVNEILDNLLEITDNQLRLSKVRLVKTFDRGIPRMKTDIGKLQQVFINIISNAVWAMPDGGELTVRTAMDGATGNVSVEFSDTGCGIPLENMGKIFDPFFTTRKNGHGTGLGLAVSYGIIREMGGKIDVKSAAAGGSAANRSGTTFIVSLPAPGGINGS
ncbi:MAG: ATP-binding protein, partial [Pseudomonadota bacterium]